MKLTLLFEQELTPVDLHLLTGLGFITPHRLVARPGRSERLHKVLQDADGARIALSTQPFQHGCASEEMVLGNPSADLVLKWVEFGLPARPGCRVGTAPQVLAHRVAGNPGLGHNGPN